MVQGLTGTMQNIFLLESGAAKLGVLGPESIRVALVHWSLSGLHIVIGNQASTQASRGHAGQ